MDRRANSWNVDIVVMAWQMLKRWTSGIVRTRGTAMLFLYGIRAWGSSLEQCPMEERWPTEGGRYKDVQTERLNGLEGTA